MMMDTERLDWLGADASRLQDVYWRMQNEDESLREAIDALVAMSEGIAG
jgi:hypothetical protein